MPTNDQLQAYRIFSGLSDADLAALAPCLSKRVLAKGAYLYHPGNPGLYTYLVEAGLIRLFFTNAQGKEFMGSMVSPGEVFGLPLWQEQQTRVMGAAALSPAVVLVIQREDLFRCMEHSPALMHNIYRELADNARNLTLRVRALTTFSLNGRLANLLLYLSAKIKTGGRKDNLYIPLSQGEVANWLGASRGRLNRSVKELSQLGLIHCERQTYTILDREGLERIIQESAPEDL